MLLPKQLGDVCIKVFFAPPTADQARREYVVEGVARAPSGDVIRSAHLVPEDQVLGRDGARKLAEAAGFAIDDILHDVDKIVIHECECGRKHKVSPSGVWSEIPRSDQA